MQKIYAILSGRTTFNKGYVSHLRDKYEIKTTTP